MSETLSLPSRECGLKFAPQKKPEDIVESLPSRECGLKSADGTGRRTRD